MTDTDGAGRRGRLSRAAVVDAALRSMDTRGVAVTSLRSVAADLGVEPMTLYHYVRNRDDLFDAVVDRVVDELDADDEVRRAPSSRWQPYLIALAGGVRRYARAHPHAFPLVATRPPQAPWINPPLRSLRWIEKTLAVLRDDGLTDDQVLFAYRRFNSFLLGALLLETSAMTLADPKPGDGALAAEAGAASAGTDADAPDPAAAVPGALSPVRSKGQRRAVADAASAAELVDPFGDVDRDRYPTIHDLASGLAEDHWSDEFAIGLHEMIEGIELHRRHGG